MLYIRHLAATAIFICPLGCSTTQQQDDKSYDKLNSSNNKNNYSYSDEYKQNEYENNGYNQNGYNQNGYNQNEYEYQSKNDRTKNSNYDDSKDSYQNEKASDYNSMDKGSRNENTDFTLNDYEGGNSSEEEFDSFESNFSSSFTSNTPNEDLGVKNVYEPLNDNITATGELKYNDLDLPTPNSKDIDNLVYFNNHFSSFLGGHPEGVYRVISDDAKIYLGPDGRHDIFGTIKRKSYVHVIRQVGSWMQIGRNRYIRSMHVKSLGLKTDRTP